MIIPCPENLREFRRFPLTITLTALNIFIFVLIFSGSSNDLSNNRLFELEGMTLTGRLYYQYLQELPAETLAETPKWVQQISTSNSDQLAILGAYALRDSHFLLNGDAGKYHGDQVQIATWREDFKKFRTDYKDQLMFRFGLSSIEKGPLSWITYQFSHSNWMHLFSNLMFLVVIGAAVEALVGSTALLAIYVLGGITGGLGFLMSQGSGVVPMVGASASVSALLAFYCVAQVKARIRYLYFISPMPEHYGSIYLPTLMIIPLFLVADLANLLAAPEGLGTGVAYAAHLGGSLFGMLGAIAYRRGMFSKPPVLTEY
ncbi:rhomboid family intramembrane serine protease [Bdellovibrio sp. SKB1291214]|uniref:rhomboid family intramembrane serine protease n=1 Tax=Bdellovibrio sp. SKB1291214 TaxID=1732569 RepID=UPI000B51D13D|nr:rhomboid family intramembrane serine protease [Bdellovibrio sp. SKB1291214]UYL09584.1 rhomboid family intramembrane serine protease [Bdellovibrio sp. SKB1291214]